MIYIILRKYLRSWVEDKLMAFAKDTGKSPALVQKEEDGFIVNNIYNVLKRRYEETGKKSNGLRHDRKDDPGGAFGQKD